MDVVARQDPITLEVTTDNEVEIAQERMGENGAIYISMSNVPLLIAALQEAYDTNK